jgi:hypothetical protein
METTMRKLLTFLIALVFTVGAAASAFAQGFNGGGFNVGLGPFASGGGYVGPGDIVSFTAWWGFRAYSAARAGTKAIRIVRASDSAQSDINSLANGSLDAATATTFCQHRTEQKTHHILLN